jgi:ATP-dependent DNA helicase DinG
MRLLGEFFADGGPLAGALGPGYSSRPEQLRMSEAVGRAIERGGALLADAKTGTGKSLAYLVPAALSGEKIILSTATKALQHQLISKYLPVLCDAVRASGLEATGEAEGAA